MKDAKDRFEKRRQDMYSNHFKKAGNNPPKKPSQKPSSSKKAPIFYYKEKDDDTGKACSVQSDCSSKGFFCDESAGQCKAKKNDGDFCIANYQCKGSCDNGKCIAALATPLAIQNNQSKPNSPSTDTSQPSFWQKNSDSLLIGGSVFLGLLLLIGIIILIISLVKRCKKQQAGPENGHSQNPPDVQNYVMKEAPAIYSEKGQAPGVFAAPEIQPPAYESARSSPESFAYQGQDSMSPDQPPQYQSSGPSFPPV